MYLYSAAVTVLTVMVIFMAMGLVGRARGKFNVSAPAVSGHPDFERVFRAHQNTLEQSVMFLPVFWMATIYSGYAGTAAAIGLIWVVARVWYVLAYANSAGKRHQAFLLGFIAFALLLVMSLVGIGHQLLIGR